MFDFEKFISLCCAFVEWSEAERRVEYQVQAFIYGASGRIGDSTFDAKKKEVGGLFAKFYWALIHTLLVGTGALDAAKVEGYLTSLFQKEKKVSSYETQDDIPRLYNLDFLGRDAPHYAKILAENNNCRLAKILFAMRQFNYWSGEPFTPDVVFSANFPIDLLTEENRAKWTTLQTAMTQEELCAEQMMRLHFGREFESFTLPMRRRYFELVFNDYIARKTLDSLREYPYKKFREEHKTLLASVKAEFSERATQPTVAITSPTSRRPLAGAGGAGAGASVSASRAGLDNGSGLPPSSAASSSSAFHTPAVPVAVSTFGDPNPRKSKKRRTGPAPSGALFHQPASSAASSSSAFHTPARPAASNQQPIPSNLPPLVPSQDGDDEAWMNELFAGSSLGAGL